MNKEIKSLASTERNQQILAFINYSTSIYVIPLFLFFSLADFIWYNKFFTEFLYIRLATAVFVYCIGYYARLQNRKNFSPENLGLILILVCGIPINYMMLRIDDAGSPYYAGLMLILVGLCVGLRFSWRYHFYCIVSLVAPFLLFFFTATIESMLNSFFLLNLTFIISLTTIGSIGKLVYEKLISKELNSRYKLNIEVEDRGKIIDAKTTENSKLSALSKQFSPQIIDSIKKGEINLDSKVSDTDVAVIFVDIVDSTRKVIELKNEDTQLIITNFIDDVMSTFLKYDVTIDKFLGDGFMGFTNAPLPRSDYVERAILASSELITKIKNKSAVYNSLWQGDFNIRVSIASGVATTGFYGNEKYLKTYTAIGKPVILASRLNGAGEPYKITISEQVLEVLSSTKTNLLNKFKVNELQNLQLKGFEKEKIKAYSIYLNESNLVSNNDDENCPHGHGQLVIESNSQGLYELRCRYCNYVNLEAS